MGFRTYGLGIGNPRILCLSEELHVVFMEAVSCLVGLAPRSNLAFFIFFWIRI